MGPRVKSQGNLFVASAAADNKKVSPSFSFYQSCCRLQVLYVLRRNLFLLIR
jgi:hypothetical protein